MQTEIPILLCIEKSTGPLIDENINLQSYNFLIVFYLLWSSFYDSYNHRFPLKLRVL